MTKIEKCLVAIVDDDHAVRDSLQFLLEIVGHPVETFASAAEFLKAEKQRIACLILDHHMPEMTGLELAERMHADGADIPILLVTASPSPAIVTRAAEVGVKGCHDVAGRRDRRQGHLHRPAFPFWPQPPHRMSAARMSPFFAALTTAAMMSLPALAPI
jgi:two-component system, LuxR family, response regulator FixJ